MTILWSYRSLYGMSIYVSLMLVQASSFGLLSLPSQCIDMLTLILSYGFKTLRWLEFFYTLVSLYALSVAWEFLVLNLFRYLSFPCHLAPFTHSSWFKEAAISSVPIWLLMYLISGLWSSCLCSSLLWFDLFLAFSLSGISVVVRPNSSTDLLPPFTGAYEVISSSMRPVSDALQSQDSSALPIPILFFVMRSFRASIISLSTVYLTPSCVRLHG